jgi:hypothetical protein
VDTGQETQDAIVAGDVPLDAIEVADARRRGRGDGERAVVVVMSG